MKEIVQILLQCISNGCKAACCRTQRSPLLWRDRRKHICGAGHCWIYRTLLGFRLFCRAICPCLGQCPKNDISASSDHLNLKCVLTDFIKLKKKLFLDQILRSNTHSRFVPQHTALYCPMGHLFKLGPQNGSPSPSSEVFLFAFNCKWTL